MQNLLQAVKTELASLKVDVKASVVTATCDLPFLAHNLSNNSCAGKYTKLRTRTHTHTDLVVVLAEVVFATQAACSLFTLRPYRDLQQDFELNAKWQQLA